MDIERRVRYEGRRWEIVFGRYEGVEEFAVNELQRFVQRCMPYVIDMVRPQEVDEKADVNRVYVGQAKEPHIKRWIAAGFVKKPAGAQAYSWAIGKAPDGEGRRVIVIAGADADGVRNGVSAFNTYAAVEVWDEKASCWQAGFDGLGDASAAEAPAVANRGLWLWGFTVYDYRRFLDNMARLRMNMVTFWNDCPPINCPQVIDYAHSRGIKVVLGFHWGWGIGGVDLHKPADRKAIMKHVVDHYKKNYAQLKADGIYFQTSTEHTTLEVDGESTATAACKLVNETARALYKIRPDLLIQFGLHATSIRERYMDLAGLDKRVVIVWEDAGGLPYTYGAEANDPEGTLEYSKKIATFRPGTEFAIVPKGWTALRWYDEFENHGPYIMGERAASWIADRYRWRQRRWDSSDARWFENYPLAARFYREVLATGVPSMTATGLVEDGVFEERIHPSIALFAEMTFNPHQSDGLILKRATSPWYRM